MLIQVLLFVKSGAESATASPTRDRKRELESRAVYTFVDPEWKSIEPVRLLKPVQGPEEISPAPRTNFELVEVWVDSPEDTPKRPEETKKKLYVEMYNLYLTRRIFSECSSLKYVAVERAPSRSAVSALTDDNIRAITKLIKSGATITYRHPKDGTLAHFAAMRGPRALISALGKCGADLNAARNDGELPLHVAVMAKNMSELLALLDSGADINGKSQEGHSVLHTAVLCWNIESVRVLIERGADVNTKALDDWTPLHSAAEVGETAMVDLLLKSGANIEAKGVGSEERDGATPLHAALKENYWKSASVLIDNGADCEVVCKKGYNAFFHAVNHRMGGEMVDLLLKRGVDVNNPGNQKAFHLAVKCCREGPMLVEKLISYGFLVPEENMPEVLFTAIRYDLCKLVERLLELGADLNHERKFYGDRRATPLRVACRSVRANWKMFQLLLDHGADPAKTHELMTLVYRKGNEEVLKLLLDRIFSIRVLSKSNKPGRELDLFREVFQKCTNGHSEGGNHSSCSESERSYVTEDDDSYSEDEYGAYEIYVNLSERLGYRKIFAKYVLKLKAASKAAGEDFDPTALDWVFRCLPSHYHSDAILKKYERELNSLRIRTISGTDVELFDLLHIGIDRFTRLLRDGRIRSEIESFNSEREFPHYGSVIESRLREATCRRQYLIKGLKAFNRLAVRLPALPMEVKEHIVEFLANHECARLDLCFK